MDVDGPTVVEVDYEGEEQDIDKEYHKGKIIKCMFKRPA